MIGHHAYSIYRGENGKGALIYCEEEALYELIAGYEGRGLDFIVFELDDSNSYQVSPEDGSCEDYQVVTFKHTYERVYRKGRWLTSKEYREIIHNQ